MKRAPIDRILVGVDGSGGAGRALEWAIGLATILDAEVIAVHAFQVPAGIPRPGPVPHAPASETWEGSVRRDFELSWCAPLAAAGVRHRMVFDAGPPAEVLLRQAETLVADLIVTGSRGRGELVELLAGSVSQPVVRGARCPVVVVPPVGAA